VRRNGERDLRREQQRRFGVHRQRLHRLRDADQRRRCLQRYDLQRHLRDRLPRLPGRGADVVRGEQQHRFGVYGHGLHGVRRSAQRRSGLQRRQLRR
jgi:hypothetical protein